MRTSSVCVEQSVRLCPRGQIQQDQYLLYHACNLHIQHIFCFSQHSTYNVTVSHRFRNEIDVYCLSLCIWDCSRSLLLSLVHCYRFCIIVSCTPSSMITVMMTTNKNERINIIKSIKSLTFSYPQHLSQVCLSFLGCLQFILRTGPYMEFPLLVQSSFSSIPILRVLGDTKSSSNNKPVVM